MQLCTVQGDTPSCCSSVTPSQSPCGSSCQSGLRPRYLDIKPVYVSTQVSHAVHVSAVSTHVSQVSHEQGSVYREYRPRAAAESVSSVSPAADVHQQLLQLLSSAAQLPPPSPLSLRQLECGLEQRYEQQSSDPESSGEEAYKGEDYDDVITLRHNLQLAQNSTSLLRQCQCQRPRVELIAIMNYDNYASPTA